MLRSSATTRRPRSPYPFRRTRRPRSALERGFAVLHCFEPVSRPLANGELSGSTGIPKPTVTRVVASLVGLGYLKPAAEADHYELSARSVGLARAFLDSVDLRASARPHLAALAEFSGASSFSPFAMLRTWCSSKPCVRARQRCRCALKSARACRSQPRARPRMAGCALGERALAQVFDELASFHGAAWPKLRRTVLRVIADTRSEGCCVSIGDWHPEINTAAVSAAQRRRRTAGDQLRRPSYSLSERRLRDEIVPRLVETARTIAREIGGSAANDAMR